MCMYACLYVCMCVCVCMYREKARERRHSGPHHESWRWSDLRSYCHWDQGDSDESALIHRWASAVQVLLHVPLPPHLWNYHYRWNPCAPALVTVSALLQAFLNLVLSFHSCTVRVWWCGTTAPVLHQSSRGMTTRDVLGHFDTFNGDTFNGAPSMELLYLHMSTHPGLPLTNLSPPIHFPLLRYPGFPPSRPSVCESFTSSRFRS